MKLRAAANAPDRKPPRGGSSEPDEKRGENFSFGTMSARRLSFFLNGWKAPSNSRAERIDLGPDKFSHAFSAISRYND